MDILSIRRMLIVGQDARSTGDGLSRMDILSVRRILIVGEDARATNGDICPGSVILLPHNTSGAFCGYG